jgi:hypothetical protein
MDDVSPPDYVTLGLTAAAFFGCGLIVGGLIRSAQRTGDLDIMMDMAKTVIPGLEPSNGDTVPNEDGNGVDDEQHSDGSERDHRGSELHTGVREHESGISTKGAASSIPALSEFEQPPVTTRPGRRLRIRTSGNNITE